MAENWALVHLRSLKYSVIEDCKDSNTDLFVPWIWDEFTSTVQFSSCAANGIQADRTAAAASSR